MFRTHKSKALKKFKEFRRSVETRLERPITSLNIDRGGKCEFKDFSEDNGLRHFSTIPYTKE